MRVFSSGKKEYKKLVKLILVLALLILLDIFIKSKVNRPHTWFEATVYQALNTPLTLGKEQIPACPQKTGKDGWEIFNNVLSVSPSCLTVLNSPLWLPL